jgi:hypothetical protein
MSHFAEVDESNTVLRVIVVADSSTTDEDGVEVDSIGEAYCADLLGGTWKRTSYSGSYRRRFAGIGFTYDEARDVFISPQPFPSWTLDENTDWQPPTSMPDGDICHFWDEDTTSWVEVV